MIDARFWRLIGNTKVKELSREDNNTLHIKAAQNMRRALREARKTHATLLHMLRTGRYMSPDGREQNDGGES